MAGRTQKDRMRRGTSGFPKTAHGRKRPQHAQSMRTSRRREADPSSAEKARRPLSCRTSPVTRGPRHGPGIRQASGKDRPQTADAARDPRATIMHADSARAPTSATLPACLSTVLHLFLPILSRKGRNIALLEQRKHFHAADRGRRRTATGRTAQGKRRIFQRLGLLGQCFKIAAGKGNQRRAERFNIQAPLQATSPALIVSLALRFLHEFSYLFIFLNTTPFCQFYLFCQLKIYILNFLNFFNFQLTFCFIPFKY